MEKITFFKEESTIHRKIAPEIGKKKKIGNFVILLQNDAIYVTVSYCNESCLVSHTTLLRTANAAESQSCYKIINSA